MCVLLLMVSSVNAQICGDCNGDGSVTVLDALVAAQVAAGFDTSRYPGMSLEACDVAAPQRVCSGPACSPPVITILDALRIAQWSLGIGAPLLCI